MTDDDLVAAYLRRLRRAARKLPRDRRQELLEQITEHIAESRARLPEPGPGEPPAEGGPAEGGPAEVRGVLDRLGDPGDIVAAALAAGGGTRTGRAGWLEIAAVAVLLAGGLAGALVAGAVGTAIAWLAGLVLLWASPRWRWPDKLLATLVWPGGLGGVLLLLLVPAGEQVCSGGTGTATTCTGGPFLPSWAGIPLSVILAVMPVLVGFWLLRRARRGAGPGGLDVPEAAAGG